MPRSSCASAAASLFAALSRHRYDECRATGDFDGSEESMTATVNGVRLSYSDVGRGTPLFCLHGGMGVDAASLHKE